MVFLIQEAAYAYDGAGNVTSNGTDGLGFNTYNLPRFLNTTSTTHRLSYIGIEEYGRQTEDLLTGNSSIRHRIGSLELLDGEPHLDDLQIPLNWFLLL